MGPGGAREPRSFEAGLLLTGAGAVLLLISLFLEWYEPELDAWTVFEVWDLVLATAALAALVAIAGRMGVGTPRPSSWLLVPAVVAFVVVVSQLIDHPPAAGADSDPETGIWLALVGASLMLAGVLLAVARISVALNVGDAGGPGRRTDPPPPAAGGPTEPTRRI